MAIDTKEKRVGVIGVGRPYLRGRFPVAVPDEEWRITRGNAYGGNALSPGVGTNRLLLIHPPGLDGGFGLDL